MRMTIAFSVLALLLMPSPRSAARPDAFWIGLVNSNGVLIPVGHYHHGKWSNPWQLGESPRDHKIGKLSEIPRSWLAREPLPSQWTLFRTDGQTRVLSLIKPVLYDVHCLQRWGLQTDYPVKKRWPANQAPFPIVGIATTVDTPIGVFQKVAANSPKLAPFRSLVKPVFEREERNAIARQLRLKESVSEGRLGTTGHPIDDVLRRKQTLTIDSAYATSLSDGFLALYYFGVVRRYEKPNSTLDSRCYGISRLDCWIAKQKEEVSIISKNFSLDDCDGKMSESPLPIGAFSVRGHNYLIVIQYSYEGEYYQILEYTRTGLMPRLVTEGGGC